MFGYRRIRSPFPTVHRLSPNSRRIHGSSQALFFGQVFKRTRALRPPPVAPKVLGRSIDACRDHRPQWHGFERTDEYSWMQDPCFENDLAKYLKEECDYARQSMQSTLALQRRLAKIMSKATEVEQVPPPVETRSGDFVYYVRQSSSGDGSFLYCRRNVVPGSSAREQVLVDTEKLANNHGFVLRHLVVSDDHRFVGCLATKVGDTSNGSETSSLIVYSLNDIGEINHLETLESVFNFVFGLDSTLFYTVLNDKLRAWKVYAHQLGMSRSKDICIYTETNDECFVDITRTKDRMFHIVNSSALDSSELYIFDSRHDFWPADNKQNNTITPLSLVRPRQKGVEYFVDHHDGEFVILTNSPKADNNGTDQIADPLPFRLVCAPTSRPSSENWSELLSVADDERIEDVEIFKAFIMVTIKRKGRPAVLIYDKYAKSFSELPLPYEGFCTVRPDSNPQFDTSTIRLCFSSPVHLDSVAKYDMRTMQQVQSWSSTPLHMDPSIYRIQRVCARNENVSVPMTLIRHKNTTQSKRTPTLLRVYGAYGVSLEPEFRLEDIPLLLRGWTIALVHVRGGGELGRSWYFGGKGKNKINSINDLLAGARFLLDEEWTSSERLAISGVSAGGLVVGAALNMMPEYFRAAALHVPFVDPLSAMLNPDLPLARVETAEWGDPVNNKSDYSTIRQYSPYDNAHLLVNAIHVPSILVTAGGQDKRVSVWQPAKWVARMRDSGRFTSQTENDKNSNSQCSLSGSRLLFYPRMDEGHFHSKDKLSEGSFINAHAFRNAFLIKEVEGADS